MRVRSAVVGGGGAVVVFVVVLPCFDGVSLQWWVGFCCLVVVFWGV